MTHNKPRHKESLRAVGREDCVLMVFLIDVRLSRPEAWAAGAICDGEELTRCRVEAKHPRMLSHLRSQGRTVERRGATMCQFSTKERKTGQLLFGAGTATSLTFVVPSFRMRLELRKAANEHLHASLVVQLPTSAVPDLPSIW